MTESNVSFSAVVTDVRLESRTGGVARWQLALDTTLFSRDSAAGVLVAIAPSGVRLEVLVREVIEEAGVVWHVVEKPLTEGTKVSGLIHADCFPSIYSQAPSSPPSAEQE